MSSDAQRFDSHFRYLPVLKAQSDWGIYLTDCGYTSIEAGSPYPPKRHPDAYHFDWQKGRILDEYQLVYITRGRGRFEARGLRQLSIEAGDVFLLFPGLWHRYAPDVATGWDEHWIGLGGEVAKRIMRPPFFTPRRPILKIGVDESLRQKFVALVHDIERDPAGLPFSSTGRVLEIIGIVQERIQNVGREPRLSVLIREAQSRILKHVADAIDFASLSRELGVSYTTFRRKFKQQTGAAPAQFQNAIRINLARELLRASELSISEIAARTGFETVFYFSRLFKLKTGKNPSAFRAQSRKS